MFNIKHVCAEGSGGLRVSGYAHVASGKYHLSAHAFSALLAGLTTPSLALVLCGVHPHQQACTVSCMAKNKAGHSPIDVAAAAGRGEVLNAMLLACSGGCAWLLVQSVRCSHADNGGSSQQGGVMLRRWRARGVRWNAHIQQCPEAFKLEKPLVLPPLLFSLPPLLTDIQVTATAQSLLQPCGSCLQPGRCQTPGHPTAAVLSCWRHLPTAWQLSRCVCFGVLVLAVGQLLSPLVFALLLSVYAASSDVAPGETIAVHGGVSNCGAIAASVLAPCCWSSSLP